MSTVTILAIIIGVLAIAVIVLTVALTAVRRDISAQRVEIYQTLQSEFSEMNRGLSDRASEEEETLTFSPEISPGSHLGIILTMRRASSVQPPPTPFTTSMFEREPSTSTTNLIYTVPL